VSEDFTEARYRELLKRAKERYRFIAFPDFAAEGPAVLWRHDIDMSPQRALALARIEAEEGVRSTYFVLLHSDFYNALEPAVVAVIREIIAAGHHLGLHFDASFWPDSFEDRLAVERDLLELVFGTDVRAFSMHNPGLGETHEILQAGEVAGMINAYGESIHQKFAYCSDSNGIWRFRRLDEVLERASDEFLQVLTHPEWWLPEALPPRARVTRAIEGRAARLHEAYDKLLADAGRPNVR
jgi:hypothetical protein